MKYHVPCLVKEILEIVRNYNCKKIIDCTAGEGGHTLAMANLVGKSGEFLAIETDPEYFQLLKKNVERYSNIVPVNGSYVDLKRIAMETGFLNPHLILFDFGLSSFHIEGSERGFSYKRDEVLDLRFNPSTGKPFYEILPSLTLKDLEIILKDFGETKFYRKLARSIYTASHQIKRTTDLNQIVKECIPASLLPNELPKIYQAFRIFVNNEISNIIKGLRSALEILSSRGVLITISYHSLEDRICKSIKNLKGIKPITKKPVTTGIEELTENPRCRSAKLRAYIKEELNEVDIETWFNTISALYAPNLHS